MKKIYSLLLGMIWVGFAFGQSEPSTYFNLYVPPNNDAVKRNAALIITAVSDSTSFTIIDDGADGDMDDSISGILMEGQSYILYIKDNGINDDALYASGGTLVRNGDYFIIHSTKLVYASMSTDSDWEHDFVPAVNKKTVGQKFYVYAPKVTQSPRDLNVFAYEANTTVSIFKISTIPTTQTGYTNIHLPTKQLVVQKTLDPGEDIIHFSREGRDIMVSGGTYLIEANRNISVQYGALWGNERDGGSYVPSSNGSGSGELFYFAVPYQSIGEQEIRIVSWDNANVVSLSRFQNGSWVSMNQWTLNQLQPSDWVGRSNANATYPTVFRVTCTPGKRVSVMEANWMETGSVNTSDMSTMLSAESGTSSGKRFLAYMLPPGRQDNVVNPFTGKFFTGSISHFYLFAGNKNTTVTVKDAKTNGQVLSKSFAIEAGRYADAFFTIEEWRRIYNGTGTAVGPERPYVIIEASEHISVLSTNFNDNWMNYFGSSLPQSFTQSGSLNTPVANPGQEVVLTSQIELNPNQVIENAQIEVRIPSGLIPISANLKYDGQQVESGNINVGTQGSLVRFNPIPVISDQDKYTVETKTLVSTTYNDGSPIPNEAVLSIGTVVSGTVNGEFQQSFFTQGLQNNAANTSNLLYSPCQISTIGAAPNNSWNPSWADYNGDGFEDLFIPTKDENAGNELYRNNGNGTFTKVLNHPLVAEKGITVGAVWMDIDNNGRLDVLLVNATQSPSKLFLNTGNGNFTELTNSGLDPHPQYFHGAAAADFDHDGYVDLLITNFFQTRFHQLYKNNGNLSFTPVNTTPVTAESERAMAPILADYNNDGFVDIFIPNGNDRPNSLFKNLGGFQFEKVLDPILQADARNSVGAAWGDYDNDGFLDLLVLNASGQNADVYHNLGNGTFEKASTGINTEGGNCHSGAWLDVNNDGWLDVIITNDSGPSFLYLNDGQGKFTRKLDEAIAGSNGNAFGLAYGDYNKDGYLDVAIATHTTGNTRFYCHNGNAKKWIGFKLQGVYANRQALGARVSIKANGQWQHRQQLPISGFGSQHTQSIHFGLDQATVVDSVIIYWPNGARQELKSYTLNQYNQVLEEASYQVSGVVFHDGNGNGVRDTDEPIIPNVSIRINNGSLFVTSDTSGRIQFRTNESSLTFGINQAHWTLDARNRSYTIPSNLNSLEVMLPLSSVTMGHDLQVFFITTAWRRGFTNHSVLQIKNGGTASAQQVKVQLDFPAQALVLEADKEFTSMPGSVYEWNLGTLQPGEIVSIAIIDSVGLNTTTGQILTVNALTFASGNDLNPANNNRLIEIELVGAIDPNDMLVSPKGDGDQGYIHKSQWLTYTIRFENIGSYAATYVFLENQLPEGLDWNTFEVLSSSHPFSYSLSEQGVLKVAYREIGLPMASEDAVKAQGYFQYTIKPQSGIEGGKVLPNKAFIRFDFEENLETNTIINTIKYEGRNEVKKLNVFPNPVFDEVQVALDVETMDVTDPQGIEWWSISDCHGQLLDQGIGNFLPSMPLTLAGLPAGLYFVHAVDQFGQVYRGKLLKE